MVSRLIFTLIILSLGAGLSAAQNQAYLEYIEQNKTLAVSEMERTGIPASIKMAQALLESNAGRSELARNANNHFGIKCGSDWEGKTYMKKDDDRNFLGMRVKSCFRHFRSTQESFIAHSELLRAPNRQSRYGFLFELDPTDYKRWARGLKKAGYATSNSYHRKLINLIEQYDLHELDYMTTADMVASNHSKRKKQPEKQNRPAPVETDRPETPAPQPEEAIASVTIDYLNDVKYIASPERESATTIAEQAGVSVEEVLRYNEFLQSPKQVVPAGVKVYLQPKRNHFRGRQTWHKVQAGESMLDISNRYAIDLDRLFVRNRMEKGEEPAPGAKIKIRGGAVDRRPPLRDSRFPEGEDRPEKIIIEDEEVEILDIEIEWNGGKPKKESQEKAESGSVPPGQGSAPGAPNNEIATTPAPQTKPVTDPFGSAKDSVAGSDQVWHTVQRGETLWRISQQYGTTVDRLKALNQLDSNHIRSGMQLKVR